MTEGQKQIWSPAREDKSPRKVMQSLSLRILKAQPDKAMSKFALIEPTLSISLE